MFFFHYLSNLRTRFCLMTTIIMLLDFWSAIFIYIYIFCVCVCVSPGMIYQQERALTWYSFLRYTDCWWICFVNHPNRFPILFHLPSLTWTKARMFFLPCKLHLLAHLQWEISNVCKKRSKTNGQYVWVSLRLNSSECRKDTMFAHRRYGSDYPVKHRILGFSQQFSNNSHILSAAETHAKMSRMLVGNFE